MLCCFCYNTLNPNRGLNDFYVLKYRKGLMSMCIDKKMYESEVECNKIRVTYNHKTKQKFISNIHIRLFHQLMICNCWFFVI